MPFLALLRWLLSYFRAETPLHMSQSFFDILVVSSWTLYGLHTDLSAAV